MIPLIFVAAITIATIVLGIAATRKSKTASDFFVAGRSVNVFWNASAISGEYLSAASFMGVAGLIMKFGYDALWYPVGYAAGYLFLLLFIAGPLRRFGAYTIPDFAQGRFDSVLFRKIAVTFVLFIGFFYTMPQMKGAGVTMTSILGWPYWVGIVVVGAVITFNVALGGMKGITLVQAFQYWAKLFAISIPAFVLLTMLGHGIPKSAAENPSGAPRIAEDTVVAIKGEAAAPNNVLATSPASPISLTFVTDTQIASIEPARKPLKTEDKLDPKQFYTVEGSESGSLDLSQPVKAGTTLRVTSQLVTENGTAVQKDGKDVHTGAKFTFKTPAKVRISSGASSKPNELPPAPNAPTDKSWMNPFGALTSKHGYPLLYTYSLIIALVCGTAGLPHILVRFYTNPDGRAAKRTTLWVMVMLGLFYVFTPVWGTMGRALMPQLYASNGTDSAVIKLPTMLPNETLGQILSGVTSAGAFAAFMSTFSGLLVSMAGAFAHDIYGKVIRPNAPDEARLKAFKFAAFGVGAICVGLGMLVESFDIAMMVGWAFAIGAASYFPLLLLGSWWRGLTMPGAATGMLLGGFASLAAIVTTMLIDKKVVVLEVSPLIRSLMEQPAIWGVPLSILTMVIVSKLTANQIPADVDMKMLRLHAPEELGHSRDYVA